MVYSLPFSNAVRTRLSPATMGDDNPLGTATFQRTFFSGPNSTGGFCPWATPDPPSPRNWGQESGLSAPTAAATTIPAVTNAIKVFIACSSTRTPVETVRHCMASVKGLPMACGLLAGPGDEL